MIRNAKLTDISAIQSVVRDFGTKGLMLPLSIGEITERIRDFYLYEIDNQIVGTIALHATWGTLAEIRSLAVLNQYQKKNLGYELMKFAIKEAVAIGATQLFALTYIPEFFKKFGFKIVDRSTLPHKVWHDCIKCTKFPDCDEIAVLKDIMENEE